MSDTPSAQPGNDAGQQPAAEPIWGVNAVYGVYDLATSPATFDVLQFLAGCEAARHAHGAQHIHISYVLGPNASFRKRTHKDHLLDDAQKMWRLNHILVPCAWQMPACSGVSVFRSRLDAHRFLSAAPQSRIFPVNYKVESPRIFLLTAAVCEFARKGLPVRGIAPDPASLAAVDDWLKGRGIDKPVVSLTLRQSTAEPAKDCDLESWLAFADHVRARGFHPVAIPDTDVALTRPEGELSDAVTWFVPGALDVGLRTALYRRSHLSMSFGGGPAFLNVYMPDTNYLIFLGYKVMPKSVPTKEELLRTMGFAWGEQFPFATATQRLDWRTDTLEHLIDGFDRIVDDIGRGTVAPGN